jgi:hypothetical protein
MNIVTSLSVFTRPEVFVADQTQELKSRLDGQRVATDIADDEDQLPGPFDRNTFCCVGLPMPFLPIYTL